MSNLKILSLILACMLLTANQAKATSYDRSYIEQLIKQSVTNYFTSEKAQKIEVLVNKIDPRIRINPCKQALAVNLPEQNNARNLNVKVFCSDSTPWHLYVPVRVSVMLPVVVAKFKMDKDTVLDSNNLDIKYIDQYKLRGQPVSSIEEVIGARTKRSLMTGKFISKKSLCFVCKGDPVTIIAQSNDFAIKTNGTAMQDGAIGEKIRIKNNRSGRVINGQVNAINQVVINL